MGLSGVCNLQVKECLFILFHLIFIKKKKIQCTLLCASSSNMERELSFWLSIYENWIIYLQIYMFETVGGFYRFASAFAYFTLRFFFIAHSSLTSSTGCPKVTLSVISGQAGLCYNVQWVSTISLGSYSYTRMISGKSIIHWSDENHINISSFFMKWHWKPHKHI